MKIEEHKKALEEHERNIRRCIDEGIGINQRNICYNVAQASVEMLSVYLLRMKLVHPSVNFDHRTFKHSKSIKDKLPFDFPEKAKILGMMREIEEKRAAICYGRRKPEKELLGMLDVYNKLKDIIGEEHE